MKKVHFLLIFAFIILSACAPSTEVIQTAIAQTLSFETQYAPTKTPEWKDISIGYDDFGVYKDLYNRTPKDLLFDVIGDEVDQYTGHTWYGKNGASNLSIEVTHFKSSIYAVEFSKNYKDFTFDVDTKEIPITNKTILGPDSYILKKDRFMYLNFVHNETNCGISIQASLPNIVPESYISQLEFLALKQIQKILDTGY
jgi:hypothetical protein